VEFVSTEDHQPVIQCNIRQITEPMEAETGERLLAAIVESSEDAIFVKALDGTIISCNAGAVRMYGYTALIPRLEVQVLPGVPL
jgi:PAS domain-containing protein